MTQRDESVCGAVSPIRRLTCQDVAGHPQTSHWGRDKAGQAWVWHDGASREQRG